MAFDLLILIASLAGGVIATVSGFGIGSILTPVFSTQIDTKLAVAVVSIPHVIGTFIRFLKLRKYIDRSLALSFGVASAIGGLAGALLNAYANAPLLAYILGVLLIVAGLSGVTGLASRLELKGPWRWIGGFAAAAFGGLVGNQGGIRSASMLGFNLPKESFIATATAIALVVDGARIPIYMFAEKERILAALPLMLIAIVGVVAGTVVGFYFLRRITNESFKRVVSAVIMCLGIFMFFQAR